MDYFHINDTMMRSVSFSEISMMLRNTRPEDMPRFRSDVRKMLMDNVEDALFDMDQHWDEIWDDAFPDDDEKKLKNAPGWDSERLEALAWEIHCYLRKYEMWIDISIYYDGKRMSTSRERGGQWDFNYNGDPFIEDDKDPRDYFEYVAKNHIISMSFEGPFYDVMNYQGGSILDGFDKLLANHGLWYERGDAWNITLYETEV